jgi:RNA polymerase-interacting CarD/CdnL/TRCF family regulator
MSINVNDLVVHPQHGVGRVVGLEIRDFNSGTKQRYYAITIPNGTIWVPVEGNGSGLRKITAKNELANYRALLVTRPKPLAADHRQRNIALLERLKESSFQARCELLRDLAAHGWRKPLNESNGILLRSTQRVVCAEWAAASGLSLGDATQEVEALLLRDRQAYEGQI